MKNKNLKNLFPELLGAADQSRQSQQHKTQTKNGQYQIKNHYVIHALLLSKYNDSVQKPNGAFLIKKNNLPINYHHNTI